MKGDKMSCKLLWEKYPGQCQAQPAFIQINEDGEIVARYNPEIGNAVPSRVWHGIDLRFDISNLLDADQIIELIKEIRPIAEKLHEYSEVMWDGNNHRRKATDDQYDDILDIISDICESYEPRDWAHCEDDDCDYCNQDL